MTKPTQSMRVVSEPTPPLDAQGQLVLEDDLEALARQLEQDANRLTVMAQVSSVAGQLRAEANQLEESMGAVGSPSLRPELSEPSHSAWAFVWRLAPFAAAAALLCLLAVPPQPPHLSDSESVSSPWGTTENTGVADDMVGPMATPPVTETNHTIPWQELTSPELEGALDALEALDASDLAETVSISI